MQTDEPAVASGLTAAATTDVAPPQKVNAEAAAAGCEGAPKATQARRLPISFCVLIAGFSRRSPATGLAT